MPTGSRCQGQTARYGFLVVLSEINWTSAKNDFTKFTNVSDDDIGDEDDIDS